MARLTEWLGGVCGRGGAAHFGSASSACSHERERDAERETMASLGAELKADLKKQHWDYGYENHGDHMRTTYRDDMVEKKGKQAAMSKEAKDDLRRCHFEYGATPAAESVGGKTTMASAFTGRRGGPSALSKAAQADLRASHFVPGYEQDMKPFMNTTAGMMDGQKGAAGEAVRCGQGRPAQISL